MSRGKLLFLATEDWFVRSHFLPLLRRARAEGYEAVVAARASGALDAEGVRVIDTPFARGSLNPLGLMQQVRELRDLIARESPTIVHAIALRPILLLALAGGDGGQVLHLTGRGYLAVGAAPWVGAISAWFRSVARRALDKAGRVLLAENEADRAWIEAGKPLPDVHVVVSPGAGVDAEKFALAPFPAERPVVVGIASRLIRSKGIDLAVSAIDRLRGEGIDVELHIAGAADADNPDRVAADELALWERIDGVTLLGRMNDTNAFWAGCHIACLPSRGGEGLPRTLLEAAACGRPIVTTDVPGCADFVRDGDTGFVVARNEVTALADAIAKLAADPAMHQRMGEAARARVVAGYTERHAADAAARAWRAVSGDG